MLTAILFPISVIAENTPEQYNVTELVSDLNSPWSMIPIDTDGSGMVDWLITERDGHIVHISSSGENTVARHFLNINDLYVAGQGGLLDVITGPHFESSGQLFISFSQGNKANNSLAIGTVTYDGKKFSDVNVLFTVTDTKNTAVHHSGRLLLLPDHTLLVTSGDGYDFRERAQKLDSQMGKILRINLDGSIPDDNPFAKAANKNTRAIYSYGHRNPQGLAFDFSNDIIYSHEHGPKGGDEVNIINAGKNYGWPLATYGLDYTGAKITPYTSFEGTEAPVVNWTPSVAPSGMAYYNIKNGGEFPSLQNSLLVTTLVDKKLYALDIRNGFKQHHVFSDIGGRLRDVYVLKDGKIAVLTDGKTAPAKLLLVTSKQ